MIILLCCYVILYYTSLLYMSRSRFGSSSTAQRGRASGDRFAMSDGAGLPADLMEVCVYIYIYIYMNIYIYIYT